MACHGDKRLRPEWIDLIGDAATDLHVSSVTAFEYADLQSRGRIPIEEPLDDLIDRFDLRLSDFPAGAWRRARELPDIHRDPIDRMLIAHALEEDFVVVTADETIRRYLGKCV